MKNKIVLLIAAAALALLPVSLRAQEVTPPPAAVTPDLSPLPDADFLLYVNPPRILNEALPRFVPEKQSADLHKALDQLKMALKIDVGQINYLVLALRVRKPVGSEPMPLPEFLMVVKGGISIATMAQVLTLVGPDAHTEKYGSHDVVLITLKDIAKLSEQMPLVGSYSEFALTSMNDGSYMAGNTGFVHAAIDAEEGRGRLNPETSRSILADPESLVSLSGSMVSGVARGLALLGPGSSGGCQCLDHLGRTTVAVRLTPGGLKITGALNADNPETAGIIKNMVAFILQQVKNFAPDDETRKVLAGLNISVDGHDVIGSGEISDATIKAMLEKQAKSKQAATQTTAPTVESKTTTATPATTKSRTTRRRRPTH